MKRFLAFVPAFLIFINFFPVFLQAENEPYRPCTNEDVIGAWTMAHQVINTDIDTKDPFYFRYQRYLFSPDKTIKHMTSSSPFTKEDLKLEDTAVADRTYDIKGDGSILIQKKDSTTVEVMTCSYITDEKQNSLPTTPHKGDLLLSFFVEQDKPPVLFRLLRREK